MTKRQILKILNNYKNQNKNYYKNLLLNLIQKEFLNSFSLPEIEHLLETLSNNRIYEAIAGLLFPICLIKYGHDNSAVEKTDFILDDQKITLIVVFNPDFDIEAELGDKLLAAGFVREDEDEVN
jgi:DNA integrity scanning protein DisA with diadenylate cyclase activity